MYLLLLQSPQKPSHPNSCWRGVLGMILGSTFNCEESNNFLKAKALQCSLQILEITSNSLHHFPLFHRVCHISSNMVMFKSPKHNNFPHHPSIPDWAPPVWHGLRQRGLTETFNEVVTELFREARRHPSRMRTFIHQKQRQHCNLMQFIPYLLDAQSMTMYFAKFFVENIRTGDTHIDGYNLLVSW